MEVIVKPGIRSLVKTLVSLTKPGIVMGNLMAMSAGFAMGSLSGFDFSLFITVVFGLSLVMASACVFNNYIDRFADKKNE